MIWAIIVFLILWTVAGCLYFFINIGGKGAGGKRWEKVLLAPVILIMMITGFL